MTTLTNEDKISIINQHKRNLEYSKYNIEITILEENSANNPNQDTLTSLNNQIEEISKKISVLDAEISKLE
jgi:predicted  nucleic acid-binding Zn-ribbon protein